MNGRIETLTVAECGPPRRHVHPLAGDEEQQTVEWLQLSHSATVKTQGRVNWGNRTNLNGFRCNGHMARNFLVARYKPEGDMLSYS